MVTTTIKLFGGSLGTGEMLIECDLSQAASPITCDGESTQYQCADCRHDESRLAEIGKRLAAAACEMHEDDFRCGWEIAEVVPALEDGQSYEIDRQSHDSGDCPISSDWLAEWGLELIGDDPSTEGHGYHLASYYDGCDEIVWAAEYDEPSKCVVMERHTLAAYVEHRGLQDDAAKKFLGIE